MRFAFKGRVSTEDNQDPESSRNWQLTRARQLIEPRGGVVVAQYFDVGHSRSLPWQRRPKAIALLAALADPHRGFDAVVIGEPQREFYGNQFGNVFPLFEHYGVELWVPEVGGPVDPKNEAHELIMSVYGGMSKGERNRIKVRVRSSMGAQARTEGRFLGGRPPYGYRLADAGPHPNPSKAAEGRRLHVLEPDPATAPVVARVFAEFVAGHGLFAIAERLTAADVLAPSAYDRARNSHRSGVAWSKGAVRAILLNPRYTGRQVWNKQRKAEVLLDVNDVGLGHTTKLRWNGKDDWIWSERVVHPPLVDDETFQRAQQVFADGSRNAANPHSPPRRRHPYQLRGLMRCAICRRRMQGSMNNGRPHYRCTFPSEYALANRTDHPRNVYVREDLVVPKLDLWIARAFSPAALDASVRTMVAGQSDTAADLVRSERERAARAAVAGFDRKLASYRAALDAGADPVLVAGWISATQAERAEAARRLDVPVDSPQSMSEQDVSDLVAELGDLAAVLGDTDAAQKAQLYAAIGVQLAYDTGYRRVSARVELDPAARAKPPPAGLIHGVGFKSPLGHQLNSMTLSTEFDVDAA